MCVNEDTCNATWLSDRESLSGSPLAWGPQTSFTAWPWADGWMDGAALLPSRTGAPDPPSAFPQRHRSGAAALPLAARTGPLPAGRELPSGSSVCSTRLLQPPWPMFERAAPSSSASRSQACPVSVIEREYRHAP
ncbi:hypothetical protein LIA77_02251 [Sarocladium implicatum]|nr:hypothetical protein LIA77_02251 [Sarocladium implicatum]